MKIQALPALSAAIRMIWPAQCLVCSDAVDGDGGVCPACWPDLPMISGLCCRLCGAPLPGAMGAAEADCDDCLRSRPPWTAGRAAFLYEGAARQLVLQLKHGDRPDLARALAARLHHALRPLIPRGPMLIVPVPLHRLRFLRRRYNQSALLARALSQRLDWPWCPDLLLRSRATQLQDGLSRSGRRDNLQGAFTLNPARVKEISRAPEAKILLIDDVMTTGATLAEATKGLRNGGAGEVFTLTLARVAPAV
ncbi:ComF family protein [Falsigemmobacter faecalis]|uniref:ComF family protein n=1 Tax=Falsigemmobacter faecalis TaxID=2488730 RepID=A0A3P3DDV7_9RHOB|nr:ComF family protein [Falsigemmobacter faecalis]RRH72507.1 ComF family protein [Falsigemmobacter faecalis]